MLHNLCSVADHVLPFVPDEQTIKATTQFLTASKKEWDEEWKAWFVSLDPLKASASQAGLEQSAGDGHVGEQESASGQRSIQGLPPGRSACRSKRRSRHRDGRSGGASAELGTSLVLSAKIAAGAHQETEQVRRNKCGMI